MDKEALRILVVEDNEDAANSFSEILKLWGHDVRVAYDGLEALCIVTSFRPDVIITDIGLPGLDGYQLAERMRRKPETKNSYMIALTAYSDPVFRRRSKMVGIKHHFAKPPDLDEIRKILAARCQLPAG